MSRFGDTANLVETIYTAVCEITTLARDLTELEPPAHVQYVDQTAVLLDEEVKILLWESADADSSPRRS